MKNQSKIRYFAGMKSVYLIGAGAMAEAYAIVLKALGITPTVIGRGVQSANLFKLNTGIEVQTQLPTEISSNSFCIVAVGVENLATVTLELIDRGAKKILVEKPGAIDLATMLNLEQVSQKAEAEIFIAYNRRFYSSVLKAKEMIKEDGGVRSMQFEFTEWSHVIRPLEKAPGVKEAWLIANSTHVIDLAFYLAEALPSQMSAYVDGYLDWHNGPSKFAGSGITTNGVTFSYSADWEAPGRWGVEILTAKNRYIFRPLEKLMVQALGSVQIQQIEIDERLDTAFKAGLYLQTQSFLQGVMQENLIHLSTQIKMTKEVYLKILKGVGA